jgi:hypothetical protein
MMLNDNRTAEARMRLEELCSAEETMTAGEVAFLAEIEVLSFGQEHDELLGRLRARTKKLARDFQACRAALLHFSGPEEVIAVDPSLRREPV